MHAPHVAGLTGCTCGERGNARELPAGDGMATDARMPGREFRPVGLLLPDDGAEPTPPAGAAYAALAELITDARDGLAGGVDRAADADADTDADARCSRAMLVEAGPSRARSSEAAPAMLAVAEPIVSTSRMMA